MREKCPYTEFFSGPYFPTFGLNLEYLSIVSPNVGKYGPEKLRTQTLFTQCIFHNYWTEHACHQYFSSFIFSDLMLYGWIFSQYRMCRKGKGSTPPPVNISWSISHMWFFHQRFMVAKDSKLIACYLVAWYVFIL